MNPTLDCASTPDAPAARRNRVRMGFFVLGASILVGLAIGATEKTIDAVLTDVVFSICIGGSIFATHLILQALFGVRRPAFGAYLWRAFVAVPVGYVGGVNLAALLLGYPVGLPSLANMAPFALIVTATTSFTLMYFFWSRGRMADAARSEADARRSTAEARLKLLQTQIEPHMLFNTLANLRELIAVDPGAAQTMIDQLIVYLRASLAASRNTMTTLGAEFAQLSAYLELMKVRMGPRLRVTIELPDALQDWPIPPMLLQPIVENAIRHGLEPTIDGGTIRIVAGRSDESVREPAAGRDDGPVAPRIRIVVEDDGIGLGEPHEPGYGTTHVRERLQMLYGDRAAMTIGPGTSHGTTVALLVPR